MGKSGIYARDSPSSISLILSYIPKIPDFQEYVTFDLIGGKKRASRRHEHDGEGRECVTASDLDRLRIRL